MMNRVLRKVYDLGLHVLQWESEVSPLGVWWSPYLVMQPPNDQLALQCRTICVRLTQFGFDASNSCARSDRRRGEDRREV